MMPGLEQIAVVLGGRIRSDRTGRHVVAPSPGEKRHDRSLSVWVSDDDVRVYSHRGIDWREAKAYVRQRFELAEWPPSRALRRRRPPARNWPLHLRELRIREVLRRRGDRIVAGQVRTSEHHPPMSALA